MTREYVEKLVLSLCDFEEEESIVDEISNEIIITETELPFANVGISHIMVSSYFFSIGVTV